MAGSVRGRLPVTPLTTPVEWPGSGLIKYPLAPTVVCNGALAHPSVNACGSTPPAFRTNTAPPYGTFGRLETKHHLPVPSLWSSTCLYRETSCITDKQKLQFRWEVFNVPNHPELQHCLMTTSMNPTSAPSPPRTIHGSCNSARSILSFSSLIGRQVRQINNPAKQSVYGVNEND